MKANKLRRLIRAVLAESPKPMPPVVTYRTLTICFSEKTVDIDGRHIGPIESDCLSMPILSGDAIFMERTGQSRVG